MKTTENISPERVRLAIQGRFNPIKDLTPESLSQRLDMFQRGFLRGFALTAQAIEERDDVMQSVAPKRKKAVARHGWEVLTVDDSMAGKRHKRALEYFYNNLTATNAVDLNERGGTKLLVRQMMDAVGKRYAVHEMVWKPSANGELTAEFRFVPLWFFENTTGTLRFLRSDYDLYGEALEADGWMVTVGDGIMIACAIAYLFKHLPLRDWLIYCERFGMPGIQGKTGASRDSEGWNAMVEAVQAFGNEFAAVTSIGESIELIDMKGTGQAPHPALVERMDRALATLWRGGDLSTISKGDAVGATVQGDESDLLEGDDAEMISETLQTQVDGRVIRYLFGEDVKPLAYFSLGTAKAEEERIALQFKRDVWKQWLADGTVSDVAANLTDLKALAAEVGLPVNEEYIEPYLPVLTEAGAVSGETVKDSEGDIVGGSVTASTQRRTPNTDQGKTAEAPTSGMGNEGNPHDGPLPGGDGAFYATVAADMHPVRKRLERILQIEDPELLKSKLAAFQAELPQLLADINADPASGHLLARTMAVAMADGLTGKGGSRGGEERS